MGTYAVLIYRVWTPPADDFQGHLLQETPANMVESDGMVFSGLDDEYWYDWMLSDVPANGNVDDG
jgi:hypothetical protein